MRGRNRIYLDYAASTPMDPEVEEAMRPYFGKIFGNPGSAHLFGQEASAAVFTARQKIAKALGANYDQIIFTGSATEANNLALRGVIDEIKKLRITNYELNKKNNSQFVIRNPKIIVSSIEHESVLETARGLEREGVEAFYVPVAKDGVIDIKQLKKALDENTVLVSVMYANNEIGTVQPILEISNIIRNFKEKIANSHTPYAIRHWPLFHTDAVQALQYLNCNVDDLGVDLMTISAHKIYGPKGIGVLYVRDKKLLKPIIIGGGQEYGLRSGTENVPYIVGFGKAIEINEKVKTKETKRVKALRNYFWQNMKKIFPKAELNGSARLTTSGSLEARLPNNLNIYFPGSSAQDRYIELDLLGVAVSPGVACSARSAKPSYVIENLGYGGDRASSSLRFSFGRLNTKQEINRAITVLKKLKK